MLYMHEEFSTFIGLRLSKSLPVPVRFAQPPSYFLKFETFDLNLVRRLSVSALS